MKKILPFAALALIVYASACNNADPNQPEGLTLISKSDCSACHHETSKVIGPSFRDIAAKYPNTPENIARLTDAIIKGSNGIWGQVPMTPHTTIPKADVEKMAGYILSLQSDKTTN